MNEIKVIPVTPKQREYDAIIVRWRKNWEKEQYCYPEVRSRDDLPPALYDSHIIEWQEVIENSGKVKITKEMLDFHKAELLLEAFQCRVEADKRYEEYRKRHEEWRNSDEYKKFKEDMEGY